MAWTGCGSGTGLSPDAMPAGTCGADVPAGQACNNLVNSAAAVTPTCTTGILPAGQGGSIVSGTYHFTAQTYYNVSSCPTTGVAETLVLAGGCLQVVSGEPLAATASATYVVQGNQLTMTTTCVDTGGLSGMLDTPTKTFTATSTTLTIFTLNSAVGNANPDRVEVFTKS